jgi:hypothetical protein
MARDQVSAFEKALIDEGIAGTQLEDIARSIHQQESGKGKNTKTSNAGAVGQMQIVPKTFKAYHPTGNIKDPYDNAVGGLRYIKDLATKAGDDVGLVAAGYYGGPKAMAKAKVGEALGDKRNPNAPNTLQYMEQVMSRVKPTTAAPETAAQGSAKPSGFFRSPVPKFIRSEAPNLGTGYNAALALMGMSDDDALTKAQETVAQNEEDNAVVDFGQAQKMLAQVQAPNAFANRQMAQQQPQRPQFMATGGEIKKFASGGLTAGVPIVQVPRLRAEDKTFFDQHSADAEKYNKEAEAYNAAIQRGVTQEDYYNLYGDVRDAGANAFQHYIDFGYNEGRQMPGFDPVYYLEANPDVAANATYGNNPFGHFIEYGATEGRSPVRPPTKTEALSLTPEQFNTRVEEAKRMAQQDATSRGVAIDVANAPENFNLSGFGFAGTSGSAMFNKGGEAKKSDKDGEAERFFEDFISAAKESGPLDLSFQSPPSQVVEGLGMVNPPPSVAGRVGTKFDALGGNVRVGAQGIAMQTPDKKILAMPGVYDIGYNTQVGPGNLDLSFQRQIQAMPGRAKDYAVNARYSYKFAEGGEVTPEPEKGSAKSMLKEVGRSTQYLPADIAGAPVDLINLGLQGVDALTGSKLAQKLPVGGAEWIIKKANEYGLMDKPTGSTTESLTRMGMGVLSPTAGPKAMVAAGKAIKGTAKSALEDLSMAATGQGGSKVAQGVAKVTGLEPSFAVPKNAKSQLQELDASMVRPSESSPFVGRLEQTLFDNPQDVFTPQQLTNWAKKNLPGQDADRLTKAIAPLMEQKRLTKQEILTAVNTTYSPKQFTIEITKPNEPIRGNAYLESYPMEDMPYIGFNKLKSTGLIVAKKPAQEIGQLRLEGVIESISSQRKAMDNYLAGIDLKTAPGNLTNIQSYIQTLPMVPIQKAQMTGLFENFADNARKEAVTMQVDGLFSKYKAQKSDMSLQEQINSLDKIANKLGLDTTLLKPEQVEREVSSALFQARRYGGEQAAVARNQLNSFIQELAPPEHKFFTGRLAHEFQGANALGFSRYADLNVDGKNMIGISELQSDLRRSLKKDRTSALGKASREAEAIEMFPNMEKRPEVITQNLIKNSIYAAAKMDKDGLVLPGMMSKKPELYTSVNKNAKAALKDMGLDTSYLKRVDPTKVYDKKLLEEKMISHYNKELANNGNEIYDFSKIPHQDQDYLLDYFSPYAIYLPKKERKSIIQYGIPYAKGGMVDKNDDENQKYI